MSDLKAFLGSSTLDLKQHLTINRILTLVTFDEVGLLSEEEYLEVMEFLNERIEMLYRLMHVVTDKYNEAQLLKEEGP